MKTILIIASILTAFPLFASAKGSAERGTTAAVGGSIAGISPQNLSGTRASDCVECHTEIFPFEKPETCGRSFFPFSSSAEKDCWQKDELSNDTDILTRENGKIRRLYRFEMPWRGFIYLLPAEKGTRNPHYVLEELK